MIPLNVLHCLAGYDMEGMHETLRKKNHYDDYDEYSGRLFCLKPHAGIMPVVRMGEVVR